MQLKKYIFFLLCVSFLLFVSQGCASSSDEKEEPEQQISYKVNLSFSYEGDWTLKGSEKSDEGLYKNIEDYLKSGIAHHVIYVYHSDDVSTGAKPVETLELDKELTGTPYDFTVTLTLPKGGYVLKAWTDLRESTGSQAYYDLSKFPQVMLSRHSGLSGYQDSFRGSQSFNANEETSEISVVMQRPVGRYVVINEDFQEILENTGYNIDEVKVVTTYTGFYPDTYSVVTDRLTDSITGEYFVIKPKAGEDGESIISADFMLMNSGGSSTSLQFHLINNKGEILASSESVSIKMNRNEMTFIRGNFLEISSGDSGGFDVDTGFDGDFNITT